ncbi:uncharacterized protein AMSG_11924 [Thecamonas trahens ATCC 50062]|uniref:At4g15545-like C-terminal domain-containing protein n=1 Tax=Thecamonas trahens ATCC 50062 TaxID=461836 RepID=A0A0L0DEE3_THETB|nr:hypothetical protein AMSG_11924 [Thecamonas trahens ATCC 50062]KNC49698.1 hypothetical protein AMSG_11924 [Thecamonas trahens ATCC 50062]|eukprot:XP_013757604.1 hypothetical protein AMSG_11924 [Thecamonas trahens ATCC 50062]
MDELDCALDLMRRLPPADVEENLAGVIDLVPDLMDELLSAVDQPLRVEKDEASGKDYLLCDYNRDGDSYRSPWSNAYNPPLDYDGTFPSERLRTFEEKANGVFDTYRSLYYEGGVSSVYAWDLDSGFACVVLIKKTEDGSGKKGAKGSWDSIHVVEVQENGADVHYKITSTIMLSLITNVPGCDDVNLSGSLTRQATSDANVSSQDSSAPHIVNIGKLVEEMESKMRNALEQIYFGKTNDIISSDLRVASGLGEANRRKALATQAMAEMGARSEFVNTLQRLHELYNAQTRTLEQELLQSQAVVVDQRNLISSLEAKVAGLNARVAEVEASHRAVVSERAHLLDENVQLAAALQKTKTDLSKLVHFKQAILHTFDDPDLAPSAAFSPQRSGASYATPRAGASAEPPLSSSVSAALNIADRYSTMAASELAYAGTGVATQSPPANNYAAPSTPLRSSVSNAAADELIAEINRSINSPSSAARASPVRPRTMPPSASTAPASPGGPALDSVDGREFFRAARARLSYEQFNAFLESIKALNNHQVTRDDTLRKAWELFGPAGEDLYAQFKALISKHA